VKRTEQDESVQYDDAKLVRLSQKLRRHSRNVPLKGSMIPVLPRAEKPCLILIRQVRSSIGCTTAQREALRTLGLRRIQQEVIRRNTREILGAVHLTRHLIRVAVLRDAEDENE